MKSSFLSLMLLFSFLGFSLACDVPLSYTQHSFLYYTDSGNAWYALDTASCYLRPLTGVISAKIISPYDDDGVYLIGQDGSRYDRGKKKGGEKIRSPQTAQAFAISGSFYDIGGGCRDPSPGVIHKQCLPIVHTVIRDDRGWYTSMYGEVRFLFTHEARAKINARLKTLSGESKNKIIQRAREYLNNSDPKISDKGLVIHLIIYSLEQGL